MAKKVSFGVKLGSHPLACNADEWLQQPANADENPTTEPMKRPTLDVPEAFHRQLKIAAVSQNMAMADLIREWIRNGLSSTFPILDLVPQEQRVSRYLESALFGCLA